MIVGLIVPTLVCAKICAQFKRHLEPWWMLEALCLSDSQLGACVCLVAQMFPSLCDPRGL